MSLSLFPERLDLGVEPFTRRVPNRPAAPQPGMSVLMVEDDPSQALLLRLMLERLDVQVTHVRHGAQAVDAVKRQCFSLVLMDYRMPVLDGVQAATQIRAWEAAQGRLPLPIVAVTACAMADERARCLACGMDGILLKPYNAEHLSALVLRYASVQSPVLAAV